MISLHECIEFSDLTDDEVAAIADHEHLPYASAAQIACGLAQSEEGTRVLRCLLTDALCDAEACGRKDRLQLARRALNQFCANHPQ
jgi:hypothetical protein